MQGPFNHSYLSSVSVAQCKLDYQACITGKKIAVRCPSMCPCPAQLQTSFTEKTGIYSYLWHTDEIKKFHPGDLVSTCFYCSLVCSELDLKEVVSRLKDWFRVLHENGNQKRVKPEKNSESIPILMVSPKPHYCRDNNYVNALRFEQWGLKIGQGLYS